KWKSLHRALGNRVLWFFPLWSMINNTTQEKAKTIASALAQIPQKMSCYFTSDWDCGKVLVWPLEYSHWLNLKTILDELVQRGHESDSSEIFSFESFPTSVSKDDLVKVFTKFVDVWTNEVPRDLCHCSLWELIAELLHPFSVQSSLLSWLHNGKVQWEISSPSLLCTCILSGLGGHDFFMERTFNEKKWSQFYSETLGKAEMWLIRTYWFGVSSPNLTNVDLLEVSTANLLNPCLRLSGEHGVVVFSLGSWSEMCQKTKPMQSHGPLPRFHKSHPKTKAFVTHGGANGIYEAIHFGIPMIGIPLFGEQHDNIAYIVAKGAAISLDFRTMTRSDLLSALEAVIDNPSYKKNAMWLSTIHHDQPMKPLDRVIFWIEFVMRHKGAKHLRPLAHNLNWYQYNSLDVIGFLLACVAVIAFLSIKFFLYIYRKFVKTGKKMK
ncbi:hypothetical protein U0070_006884, partial [Myodes glareolus]